MLKECVIMDMNVRIRVNLQGAFYSSPCSRLFGPSNGLWVQVQIYSYLHLSDEKTGSSRVRDMLVLE